MIEREEMLKSVRHYMQHDGVKGTKQSGCIDGWATLHLVTTFFEAEIFSRDDVIKLIQEARTLFGDCEESNLYPIFKAQFPEAFEQNE